MVPTSEIVNSLFGAWRLARRDAAAMRFFNATIDGFWRSFFAAAVALPGYAILVWLRLADRLLPEGAVHALLIEAISYVIGWTAFPLAAFYLVQIFGRPNRYIAYIVAYNWAAVLQVALYVPTALLVGGDLLPQFAGNVIALAVTAAVIFYQYFIARTALGVGAPPALALVGVDLVLSVAVHAVVESMQRADVAV